MVVVGSLLLVRLLPPGLARRGIPVCLPVGLMSGAIVVVHGRPTAGGLHITGGGRHLLRSGSRGRVLALSLLLVSTSSASTLLVVVTTSAMRRWWSRCGRRVRWAGNPGTSSTNAAAAVRQRTAVADESSAIDNVRTGVLPHPFLVPLVGAVALPVVIVIAGTVPVPVRRVASASAGLLLALRINSATVEVVVMVVVVFWWSVVRGLSALAIGRVTAAVIRLELPAGYRRPVQGGRRRR